MSETQPPRLASKVALVTGAGSGIGRAIALRFAAEGASVGVLEQDAAGGRDTVASVVAAGGSAAYFPCDVRNGESVRSAFDAAEERLGPLQVLVNNAGIAHVGTVEGTSEADLDRVYSVNVKGVYHCLRAGVERMKGRGGVILNLGSVAASVGIPDRFAYMMSKGAVYAMTLSVARDYVDQGIRCNSIAPGRVHTPFVDGYLARDYPGREREMFEKLARTQPIGRMGDPEEIAALALYLCSDEAAFITGSNFPIDGGFITLKV
jgi:NAD(P)-dependent dehydrogenase (short-subunit alcohol dehydrogenase family)